MDTGINIHNVLELECNAVYKMPFLEGDYELTPLIFAVINNKINLVKKLLEKKADVNMCINYGDSALKFAIVFIHSPEIAELLLQNGADPDIADNTGRTIIFHSIVHCYNSNLKINLFKLLIKYGADINRRDQNGLTPLFYTVRNEDFLKFQLLIDKGADLSLMYNSQHIRDECNVVLDKPEVNILEFSTIFFKDRDSGDRFLNLLDELSGGKNVKVADTLLFE